MMLIDPDYARIYTKMRIKGWQYGWAVVVHGSMTRDLDLLMVPWDAHCMPDSADHVIKMLMKDEKLHLTNMQKDADPYKATIDWTPKPFGRKATSLHFPGFGDPRWVDISVVPAHRKPLSDEKIMEVYKAHMESTEGWDPVAFARGLLAEQVQAK